MYRPFITCDDPKGVVECGTIRKSKSSVQKTEGKIEKSTIEKHSSKASMAYKAEEETFSKGVIDEYQNPSSFQLLEISRGAQRLNRMIDAWSKGMSYSGQPKDIAKDLLKGALDLQESIVMLGKLHEASNYMSRLKRKHKEKTVRGRIDEVEREGGSSDRFGDRIDHNGCEKPGLSEDSSSRIDIEELTKAIQDGLARRNLLPRIAIQERTYSGRRKMDSAFDIPSTSSNQSSLVQFNCGNATDACFSLPKVPQNKEKGLNVIARLMGLEDLPSRPLQQKAQEKQVAAEKMLSPRRPGFEIEMPKLRKPQHIVQNEDSKRRTLKEVLETMHFKGLLKSNSVKLVKSRSHQSGEFYSNQRPINDFPPIVLIKPMRGTRTGSEEFHQSLDWEEETQNRKMMLRKIEVQEGPISTSVAYEENTLKASRMHYKSETQNGRAKSLSQKGAKDYRDEVVVVEVKEVRTVDEKERAADVKLHKKLEAKDTSKKRLNQEGPKDQMEAIAEVEEKEVSKKLKTSSRSKASSPVAHQKQKREIAEKRVDKIQKAAPAGKKTMERETLKPKTMSTSHDQAKVITTKPKNHESTSSITQNDVAREQTATRKSISEHQTQSRNYSSKYGRRKENTVNGTFAAKVTTENFEQKDVKEINLVFDHDSLGQGIVISVEHQPLQDLQNGNAIEVEVEGRGNESQSSVCDAIIPVSECQNDAETFEESKDTISHVGRDGTSSKSENQLKIFLLSNQSFLSHAHELFHLDTGCTVILPTSAIDDSKVAESKLVLDYAYEYIDRRSLPYSQAVHHFAPTYRDYLRIILSLDHLVDEICIGIETLRSYSKVAANSIPADTLYATLERDMRCKGVLTATWELGWRNGFSVDDIEQTVIDVENQLLCELINEVFA